MSLQYIIDGCNIINHRQFIEQLSRKTRLPKSALLEFILRNKLCGSLNNKIIVVFDGYPESSFNKTDIGAEVIFSRSQTADEKIKHMLDGSPNPKNVVVVSDDKEIKFFARACGAKVMAVEDFIPPKEEKRKDESDSLKAELNYSQIEKINEELRSIWLK